jgi:hypothetical protein
MPTEGKKAIVLRDFILVVASMTRVFSIKKTTSKSQKVEWNEQRTGIW